METNNTELWNLIMLFAIIQFIFDLAIGVWLAAIYMKMK